jgi:hypothetical protein
MRVAETVAPRLDLLSPNKNCVLLRCGRETKDNVDIERLCSRTVDLGTLHMKLCIIIAHGRRVHSWARASSAHFYLIWTPGLRKIMT